MTVPARDLAFLRGQLAGRTGPALWRSLDALSGTPAFRQFLEAEFPAASRLANGPDRRRFLGLMAASLSLAGLTGCDDVPDGRAQEVPYVRNPERIEAGQPLAYASAALVDGFANGVLVTTRNGRPLKIEGNDQHPWSRGGTDIFGQASVLGLWDPFRAQSVQQLGRASAWQAFRSGTVAQFATLRAQGGRGLRVLTGTVTSPSLAAQLAAIRTALPEMHWHAHAPVGREALYAGTVRAYGRPLETRWRFERAQVIVALDGDFLDPGPHQVGVSRDWVAARRASAQPGAGGAGTLLAMHAVSPTPTLTSVKADHALVAGPAEIAALAQGLLADIAAGTPAAADGSPAGQWRARAAAALLAARGRGIVLAGSAAPVAVQEATHRLNAALGNTGATVFHTDPVPVPAEELASLVQAMRQGQVEALLMLDTNPAYDAPADLGFADALTRVKLKVSAGIYSDETGARSDWHLPLAHPLERWGDARSVDGTVSLVQPTVAPLYGGRSVPEILSLVADDQPREGLDLLRSHWQGETPDAASAARWRQALSDGFLPDTALPERTVRLAAASPVTAAPAPAAPGLAVLFRPDPTIWDGVVAPNAWLQELPKPLTKLVWENAIAVSPALAEREHLATGDVVTLTVAGRTLAGPVWVTPGQATDAVTVTLGYGRVLPDSIADGLGYDAYALRGADAQWQAEGATLTKLNTRQALATTQDHGTMEGHDFIRVQALGAPPVGDHGPALPTLYPDREGDGRAWGMVIDLDACIGCNACVVGCQSENNIAVVGKEQVALGREMHWLRIDRYYEGTDLDAPTTRFQPIPCMHCEQAPCEVGCPVEATLHDHEGLNLMVYNRCVGTRACSGYCPYKVRHFNWFDYSANAAPSVQQQRNPEVTVRAAGVMEKCTYCVERIADARIIADKGDEHIPDGSVRTACQAACPTRAISFGDLNDQGSAVRVAAHDPRNYALLGELNLRPRTTYLAALAPQAST